MRKGRAAERCKAAEQHAKAAAAAITFGISKRPGGGVEGGGYGRRREGGRGREGASCSRG